MSKYDFVTNEDTNSIFSDSREIFTHRHMKIISLYSHLSLRYYDDKLDDLPDSLESLYLPRYFNQPINNLPKSLKKLSIGDFYGHDEFNHPIDNLPNSLEYLKLGGKFNQSVDFLPNSLKIIIIDGQFNQPIDNLPNTLEKLYLGKKNSLYQFNQSINNLPKSLKLLLLNISTDYIIINNLPDELEELILKNFEINCTIPKNIKKISLLNDKLINKIPKQYHAICDCKK